MHLSDILNHLGEERAKYYNAVSPPIIQSSNFVFNSFDDLKSAFQNEFENTLYTRGNNPTVQILRKKLAALEGAEDALVFGSGVAAIAAAVMSQVAAGDHIVCINSPYSWTHKLLTKYLPRFGVTHSFVEGKAPEQIEKAIRKNTKVLFLESPNSMLMELQDLKKCAEIAGKHNIVTIIDNSFASPIFQKPLSFGIDIVVHSGTKYLNGHSDVVCGVLCANKKMVKKIFETEFMNIGGIISPNDAALIIRGLRTLELRMEKSNDSALKIINWLESRPEVEKINHPFSKDYPQKELARRQMSGCGGLFSVNFKTESIDNIRKFTDALNRFLFAVSWGGHESLIIPIAAFYNQPGQPDPELPWNLVRFYVGLEDPDWLIEDLESAMQFL